MRRVPPAAFPSTSNTMPYRDGLEGQYPGSYVPAEFPNTVLAELCHLIEYSGQELSGSDLQQVRKAIAAMIASALSGSGVTPTDWRVVDGGPTATPPGDPTTNSQYLVAASGTGAFSGRDFQLAVWNGTEWAFSTVVPGRVFRIGETGTYHTRVSGGWASWTLPISAITNLQAALDGKLALNPAGGAAQTITGSGLTLQGAWPSYALQRTADAQANSIYGRRAVGHAIWGILLGEGTSDDFIINRWNVAGAYLDTPIRITYAGDTSIGVPGRTTTIQKSIIGDDRIELGVNNSGDRAAYIDFHASGAPWANDFSARILRNAGVNGALEFANTGTGGIALGSPLSLSGSLGTSGNVAKSNGPGSPPSWASVIDLTPRLQYQLRYASGTARQNLAGALPAWVKIPLNTAIVNEAGWTCSAGVVTLPAGSYRVETSATLEASSFMLRLRNTTNNVTLMATAISSLMSTPVYSMSSGDGQFTLSSPANIELQLYNFNSAHEVYSPGVSGSPEAQIVASLTLEKVA